MNDSTIVALKEELNDGFSVEYEVFPVYNPSDFKDEDKARIAKSIADIDRQSEELSAKIDKLNVDIDRLTNHADGIDYMVAVASGVLCGLIDSFVVGEFDFKGAKAKSNRQVNDFIMKFAKKNGYEGERLNGAIDFLEKKFPVAQDNIWKGKNIGVSAKDHHLADFAHHPTLFGLIAAVVVQFFRVGLFVNRGGEWQFAFVDTAPKELLKTWLPVIISGILLWMTNIAEAKYEEKLDKQIPKPIKALIKALAAAPAVIQILKIAGNWAGHLVSDMGGSKNTAGGGMGIPGLFLSLLHELSSMPLLKDTGLPAVVNDIYKKQKFDMRSELAVLNELGRQAIPVLLGDVLVRTFYFVRHLISEYKAHNGFKEVDWKNVIPFNNRTIARMMTIESGTFTAIDLADAAIRSAIKNAGQVQSPTFWKDFILRVNFVGIGRFVIAVGTDVGMGIKRQRLIKERMQYKSENDMLQTAKVYYLQEGMWIEAVDTQKAMDELLKTAEQTVIYFNESYLQIEDSLNKIQDVDIDCVEANNPGLVSDLKDILEWG